MHSVEAAVGYRKVGTRAGQFDDRVDYYIFNARVGVGHVTAGAPDHSLTARMALLSGKPRQAAVTYHRVTADRQRPQRRRRHRKRAPLKRPEVVVGQVEVAQRRRVTQHSFR